MERKKILIVDDDDNMRDAMSETLKRMNLDIDTAYNGKIGYEKALNKSYDLIISDMRMPEMSGLEMFKHMKTAGLNTPVCFVTAYGTVDDAVYALKHGAFDYILKPFSPEVIEQLVERVFEMEISTKPQKNTKNAAVFKSAYMAKLFELAKDVAQSEATVLITGASGTGKEVFAKFIHENSKRANNPFITVNCAAIPENLIESELFGFEKGAFTGAANKKPGKFELANKGTILLDEIGEIPLNLQAKLLRVLQEKEIEKIGSIKVQKVDVRIIATTNRDLKKEVEKGNFREDLYYRLNVITLEIPSLKDRIDDIDVLADFFVEKYCKINKKPKKKLTKEAVIALKEYDWPGNVRELEHTLERAVVLSKQNEITAKDLFIHGITINDLTIDLEINSPSYNDSSEENFSLSKSDVGKTISEVEKNLILNTLKEVGGNRTKAAEILGITVRTLRNKLNEYKSKGINIEDYLN
jgi:two-component system response regulator FlrC